ncbi:hypothetical protein K8Q98_01935 [Candidatus Nomurabacteria bacterium]|nr:hypothetical protein [Candidatus Nomurabacteria bacterium]
MKEHPPANKPKIDIERKKTQEYPREFFELQIQLARKVAQILKVPLSEVLLEYTSLYRRFNLGKKTDASNPLWQEFIASITDENVDEQAYQFYLKRKDIELPKEGNKEKFGCFTSEYKPKEGYVRMHFSNKEENGSPFDDENLSKRHEELKRMFEHVKSNCPEAKVVKGSSWLYNLKKYQRFFPPEYTQNPKPTSRRFTGLSGWGQFLDKDMKIKPGAANLFHKKLAEAKSLDELLDSLPLRTLEVETKVEDFYNFYGIK